MSRLSPLLVTIALLGFAGVARADITPLVQVLPHGEGANVQRMPTGALFEAHSQYDQLRCVANDPTGQVFYDEQYFGSLSMEEVGPSAVLSDGPDRMVIAGYYVREIGWYEYEQGLFLAEAYPYTGVFSYNLTGIEFLNFVDMVKTGDGFLGLKSTAPELYPVSADLATVEPRIDDGDNLVALTQNGGSFEEYKHTWIRIGALEMATFVRLIPGSDGRTLPPGDGSLDVYAWLLNAGQAPRTVSLATSVHAPGGGVLPMSAHTLSLGADGADRLAFIPVTVTVNADDPAGRYALVGTVSDPTEPASTQATLTLTRDAAFRTGALAREAETRPSHPAITAIAPNPANPTATIEFALPKAAVARVEVFDIQGRLVSTLQPETGLAAGGHRVTVDGSRWSSGVYLVRLSTDAGMSDIRRMVLVK